MVRYFVWNAAIIGCLSACVVKEPLGDTDGGTSATGSGAATSSSGSSSACVIAGGYCAYSASNACPDGGSPVPVGSSLYGSCVSPPTGGTEILYSNCCLPQSTSGTGTSGIASSSSSSSSGESPSSSSGSSSGGCQVYPYENCNSMPISCSCGDGTTQESGCGTSEPTCAAACCDHGGLASTSGTTGGTTGGSGTSGGNNNGGTTGGQCQTSWPSDGGDSVCSWAFDCSCNDGSTQPAGCIGAEVTECCPGLPPNCGDACCSHGGYQACTQDSDCGQKNCPVQPSCAAQGVCINETCDYDCSSCYPTEPTLPCGDGGCAGLTQSCSETCQGSDIIAYVCDPLPQACDGTPTCACLYDAGFPGIDCIDSDGGVILMDGC